MFYTFTRCTRTDLRDMRTSLAARHGHILIVNNSFLGEPGTITVEGTPLAIARAKAWMMLRTLERIQSHLLREVQNRADRLQARLARQQRP